MDHIYRTWQDGARATPTEVSQINASREFLRHAAETASNVIVTKDISVALNELLKKYRQRVQQSKRRYEARNSLIFGGSGPQNNRSVRSSMSGISDNAHSSAKAMNRRSFAMASHYAA